MKTHKKILTAFLLNLLFSVFEFFGGIYTGSVAILSDALHDLGDSISIGVSYFLEKLSLKKPDKNYTYGYLRYSLLGSAITNFILLFGSIIVSVRAVTRILNPEAINYNGMIIFAIVGFIINTLAAVLTHSEGSLNEKAVNLHMLEDSLGWAIVLIGAVIMKFTNLWILDPVLSLGLSIFIFINALKNATQLLSIFLERVPKDISITEIEHHLKEIDGVIDLHHLHIRSLDGYRHEATFHLVIDGNAAEIKRAVRQQLYNHGIVHSVIETETKLEDCSVQYCHIDKIKHHHHHHN